MNSKIIWPDSIRFQTYFQRIIYTIHIPHVSPDTVASCPCRSAALADGWIELTTRSTTGNGDCQQLLQFDVTVVGLVTSAETEPLISAHSPCPITRGLHSAETEIRRSEFNRTPAELAPQLQLQQMIDFLSQRISISACFDAITYDQKKQTDAVFLIRIYITRLTFIDPGQQRIPRPTVHRQGLWG